MENKSGTTLGKTALITGPTSGIGQELATLFAKDGYDLVLVSRDDDSLQQTAQSLEQQYGVKTTLIAQDLSEDQAAQKIYDQTKQQGINVSVLVNNAGRGEYGLFATETDLEKEVDVIHINVVSPVSLTKLYLKDMVRRNEGKILMLGSVASVVPNPLMAVYGGTKSFIYSFSEALRNELKDTNVTLTVLMPGATDTDFFNKAGAMNTIAQDKARSTSAADVAKTGYEALMSGKDKVVHGVANKASIAMAHLLPDSTLASNARSDMQDRQEAEDNSLIVPLSVGLAALAVAGLVVLAAWSRKHPVEAAYTKAKYKYKGNVLKHNVQGHVDSLVEDAKTAAGKLKKVIS